MRYARIEVKTDSGCKYKYIQFEKDWLLGRHLVRYYKGKEYTWEEIAEENLGAIRAMMGLSKFNKIKWTILKGE